MKEIMQEQAMSNEVCELKISELFSTDQYRIPIYQRDYAWEEQEIHQLIQDVKDSIKSKVNKYYIGTLVVNDIGALVVDKKAEDNSTVYEVIDGQQRLTTLFILLCVLKHENENQNEFKERLDFESRPKSKAALEQISCNSSDISSETEYQTSILDGYEIVKTAIDKIKKEGSQENFFDYLLNNVILYRVVTPKNIDVNHYFEIMNTRGEQLEKHEILKANLMAKLSSPSDRDCFAKIWDACSDMNKYVEKNCEVKINGEGKILWENTEGNGNEENSAATTNTNESISIINIIKGNGDFPKSSGPSNSDKTEERFSAIIDFPNFLLHVLKLCFSDKEVSLDDKQLLNHFKNIIENEEQVKDFAENLLKYRKLFDQYIIKRDFQDNSEKWVIKHNENTDEDDSDVGKDIMMLQAMFHVSNPAMTYKNWLFETLKWIGNLDQEKDFAIYLKTQLEERAREQLKNYFPVLDQGTQVPHFIFNYLDYLLWKKDTYFGGKQKPDDFVFKFNNSIEHFYPQHPSGEEKLELRDEILNDFGNLALISRSQNSRLSNFMPSSKVGEYNSATKNSATKQSLKLKLMMDITNKSTREDKFKWGEDEIKEHGKKMKKLLLDSLNNTDPPNNP